MLGGHTSIIPAFVCGVVLILFAYFREKVSLSSHSRLGIHYVDQAGLKLRDLPVSASQILELNVCV